MCGQIAASAKAERAPTKAQIATQPLHGVASTGEGRRNGVAGCGLGLHHD
ncbi:MAG: hypothetical protein IT304_10510 [Dehalococcoidia bacterium]|nr:hypothetical protein [Dehalococcoidia bacterium]